MSESKLTLQQLIDSVVDVEEKAKDFGFRIALPLTRDMLSMSRGELANNLEHSFKAGAESVANRLVPALKEAILKLNDYKSFGLPDSYGGYNYAARGALETIRSILECGE